MKLEPFLMERMQSRWENRVSHNLSESGVHPMTLGELLPAGEAAALSGQSLGYVQTNGTDALRAAVASLYAGASDGNVVVTNGTAEANFIAVWKLVEPGDDVVLMLPNYMQIQGLVRSFGGRVVPLPLREENGWNLDPDDLRKATTDRTRLIALCNPNNPTGSILSDEARSEVAAVAERTGAWVLSDEVYRGAERDGRETASLWGCCERVLVTCGLSKAYGLPGLRIGWIAGPAGTVEELWGRKDYVTICPSILSDRIARAALEPDTRQRILDRTRRIIRDNFATLEAWLARREESFRMVAPRAGAIALVRYAWDVNSTRLVRRLRDERGVLVVPGDHFEIDGTLRIGFGNEPGELRAGLEAMDPLLDTLPAASARTRPARPAHRREDA